MSSRVSLPLLGALKIPAKKPATAAITAPSATFLPVDSFDIISPSYVLLRLQPYLQKIYQEPLALRSF